MPVISSLLCNIAMARIAITMVAHGKHQGLSILLNIYYLHYRLIFKLIILKP